ncbi:hypothetical protein BGZ83_011020 [Gryganskiella cystojenkinii]|nr:hypothetical protein BGZ83_011020 [Gryganskiella cystojenkinii]
MTTLTYTPVEDIPQIIQELRSTFNSGLTKSLQYRKEQLKGLHSLVAENEEAFKEASFKDLHKHSMELILGEAGMVKQECIDAIKQLGQWAKPRKVKGKFLTRMDGPHVRKEPLGVVLIIGAWNYPLNLLLCPAVGAIAAGNTVLLKPSEVAPHTAALITKLLPVYLDSRAYRVVNGAATETTLVLEHKFDHIFYTGSGDIGRVIMTAAAKQLTPVVLELGGKSPVFVAKDTDVALTARRLVWSKFYNCGQTCIAPDYLLVERGLEQDLITHMKATIQEFWQGNPQTSNSYGRIINRQHFQRLMNMLNRTRGDIVVGGPAQSDESDLFFHPTLVANVRPDDALMESELFGPILPILVVDSMQQAIDLVNKRDQPLALYVFSKNKKTIDNILDHTRSGSVVVNDALTQFVISGMPFGGTGPSGIGNYHGERSFDIFSHERGTVIKKQAMERVNNIRYPPYSEKKLSWAQWLLYDKKKFGPNAANPGAAAARAKL